MLLKLEDITSRKFKLIPFMEATENLESPYGSRYNLDIKIQRDDLTIVTTENLNEGTI